MKPYISILSLLLLSACSSSTVIRSSDPEARIFVNGEFLGTGEATYTDRKVAFSKNEVVIRKEGCAAVENSFRRNEEPDFGAIVSGILITIPFLWVTEYKDEHAYEFDCAQAEEQVASEA